MIKNLNILAEKLKGIKIGDEDFTPEVFTAALTAEDKEVELKLPEGNFITDAELETYKSKVGNGSMKDGVIAGAEQLSKALKKATGLDFEGKIVRDGTDNVDFDGTAKIVAKHLKDKLAEELKLPSDKKVNELQESLNRLQSTYEQEQQQWKQTDEQWKQKFEGLRVDTAIMSKAQGIKDAQLVLHPKHVVAALRSDGYGLEITETGEEVLVKNGAHVKDKMENNIKFDDFFTDYLKNNNFVQMPNGRGGANEPGGASNPQGFKTINDVYKYMETNNIDPIKAEGIKLLEDFAASKDK